jgi:hypothetical protein
VQVSPYGIARPNAMAQGRKCTSHNVRDPALPQADSPLAIPASCDRIRGAFAKSWAYGQIARSYLINGLPQSDSLRRPNRSTLGYYTGVNSPIDAQEQRNVASTHDVEGKEPCSE